MKITVIPVGMLGTNCYLLASKENNCVVVDPGAQPEKIKDEIQAQGLTPKTILLTHGHHDHIGGVKKLMGYFPEVELYIGEGDLEQLTDPQKSFAVMRGMNPEDAHIPDAKGVADGQELQLDELTLKVVETPGHTKGGVCYLVEDVMFSGDTLFRDDIGRCDLYGGSYPVMKKSLAKLVALPGDYTVYPGHGEATSLEHERQHNPYINE